MKSKLLEIFILFVSMMVVLTGLFSFDVFAADLTQKHSDGTTMVTAKILEPSSSPDEPPPQDSDPIKTGEVLCIWVPVLIMIISFIIFIICKIKSFDCKDTQPHRK